MIHPSRETFLQQSEQGNLIPVHREIIADVHTPVSAYMKLDTGVHSFLLESAEQEERFGRYSIIGVDPLLVFTQRGNEVEIEEGGQVRRHQSEADPLQELQKLMARYRPVAMQGDLPLFYGGAVGYLAYEAVRFFEPKVGMARTNDLNVPDACFIITRSLLVFDHLRRHLKIVVNVHVEGDPGAAYEQAVARLEEMETQLRSPMVCPHLHPEPSPDLPVPKANMTEEEYVLMTESMQRFIYEGDIFQVVPSQRFSVPFHQDALDLYRALRHVNPSPYMFCLKLRGFSIVGSSPETHVRCENGNVEIHPIAGTRPRREDAEEDAAMARELLSDPKELAEHVMLVDLARNDVGRVCDFHSVQVTRFKEIERYSHVMHIVSRVVGRLRPGYSPYDVLRATFPAGTVTGSPKVRAMQIIGEHEPTRRGIYSGAVGYFSFAGNLDSCIAIRTVLLKAGTAYIQAGGGLVADSTPQGEYEESRNKAKAALKAVALSALFR